jgi:hypothetical protein
VREETFQPLFKDLKAQSRLVERRCGTVWAKRTASLVICLRVVIGLISAVKVETWRKVGSLTGWALQLAKSYFGAE